MCAEEFVSFSSSAGAGVSKPWRGFRSSGLRKVVTATQPPAAVKACVKPKLECDVSNGWAPAAQPAIKTPPPAEGRRAKSKLLPLGPASRREFWPERSQAAGARLWLHRGDAFDESFDPGNRTLPRRIPI